MDLEQFLVAGFQFFPEGVEFLAFGGEGAGEPVDFLLVDFDFCLLSFELSECLLVDIEEDVFFFQFVQGNKFCAHFQIGQSPGEAAADGEAEEEVEQVHVHRRNSSAVLTVGACGYGLRT